MIVYLCGIALVALVFFSVQNKKNAIVVSILTDLNATIGGRLVKSGLFSTPKLIVPAHDLDITVSTMVAGAKANGSAGRQAIWYASSQFAKDSGVSFQVNSKPVDSATFSVKTTYTSGDGYFDDAFKVLMASADEGAEVAKILDKNIRYQLHQLLDTYPKIRVNVINGWLTVSVPFASIKKGGELTPLIALQKALIDRCVTSVAG